MKIKDVKNLLNVYTTGKEYLVEIIVFDNLEKDRFYKSYDEFLDDKSIDDYDLALNRIKCHQIDIFNDYISIWCE